MNGQEFKALNAGLLAKQLLGKFQPIFNCETLGSHCRHARMFSSLPNILGWLLKTPVKCLQVIGNVKLLKTMAVIFNKVVPLSRVSVRISNVISN